MHELAHISSKMARCACGWVTVLQGEHSVMAGKDMLLDKYNEHKKDS